MDFEIPNTNSVDVMMGGDSVIHVEVESMQVAEQHQLHPDPENGDDIIMERNEEDQQPTQKVDNNHPVVPEQEEDAISPAPIPTTAVEDLPVENDQPSASPTPTPTPPAPTVAATTTTTGLQIVTRKRSSLNAPPAQDATVMVSPQPAAAPPPTQKDVVTGKAEGPAKKKKKYIPKPKATSTPKPTAASKPKRASSAGGASKSKSSRKQPAQQKKGNKTTPSPAGGVAVTTHPENVDDLCQPPPLKFQLPKLTKIPSQIQLQMQLQEQNLPPTLELEPPAPTLIPLDLAKDEHMDFDNDDDHTDAVVDPSLPSAMDQEDGGDGVNGASSSSTGGAGKPSRKKKSKGRNGNIYIGVFNRIEWMKLQEEYGFQSVNNFGTFVLQTMRKLHGDISFWCNLAKASGVYPELEKYVWRNGFPHAVNVEGEAYTPPEVDLSDQKREEVVSLAKSMWDQRIQDLRQQAQQEQQQAAADGNGGGGGEVITVPEEGDEDDNEEEEAAEDPGLENYLENMANGKYSVELVGAVQTGAGDAAKVETSAGSGSGGGGPNVQEGKLSEEQVNSIWKEQVNNVQTLEEYGKLFNLINSIHQGGDEVVNEMTTTTVVDGEDSQKEN